MFGMGPVHARFGIDSGDLRVTDPPENCVATVSIRAASFASGNTKRDKDVRSAGLLDTDTYPDITFTGTGLQRDAAGWVLDGTVSAHGAKVPTRLVIDSITPVGDGIRVHAQAAHLDRYAFGITGSKGMVGRYLDLELDVHATPAP
jgi:polyisoprenoid-binding protein YceI